jgi:hypothetical protein
MIGSTSSRPRSIVFRTVLTVAAAAAFIGAVALIAGPRSAPPDDGPGALTRGGPGVAADDNPEAAEQAEIAEERNEAYERAKEQGKAGQVRPDSKAAANAPAPGWVGE